ncbi:hypothetical protein ABK040_002958 [Willaertia magna]
MSSNKTPTTSSSSDSNNKNDNTFFNVKEEKNEKNGEITQRHTFQVNLDKECPILEKIYRDCFTNWYNNVFMAGKGLENECRDEWEDFSTCMKIKYNEKVLEIAIEKKENEKEWRILTDEDKKL